MSPLCIAFHSLSQAFCRFAILPTSHRIFRQTWVKKLCTGFPSFAPDQPAPQNMARWLLAGCLSIGSRSAGRGRWLFIASLHDTPYETKSGR
jgi:hypothetical protein